MNTLIERALEELDKPSGYTSAGIYTQAIRCACISFLALVAEIHTWNQREEEKMNGPVSLDTDKS